MKKIAFLAIALASVLVLPVRAEDAAVVEPVSEESQAKCPEGCHCPSDKDVTCPSDEAHAS